jgi:hypothetical protein
VHGVASGDSLDVHGIHAVQHGKLDVLVGGLVQVLQERQRRLAQPDTARREAGRLPQP